MIDRIRDCHDTPHSILTCKSSGCRIVISRLSIVLSIFLFSISSECKRLDNISMFYVLMSIRIISVTLSRLRIKPVSKNIVSIRTVCSTVCTGQIHGTSKFICLIKASVLSVFNTYYIFIICVCYYFAISNLHNEIIVIHGDICNVANLLSVRFLGNSHTGIIVLVVDLSTKLTLRINHSMLNEALHIKVVGF